MTTTTLSDTAAALRLEHNSAAGDLEWWRATLDVEHELRVTRSLPVAAAVAHRASTAVTARAEQLGMTLPNPDVTLVARAAADVARALVAGDRYAQPLMVKLQLGGVPGRTPAFAGRGDR